MLGSQCQIYKLGFICVASLKSLTIFNNLGKQQKVLSSKHKDPVKIYTVFLILFNSDVLLIKRVEVAKMFMEELL